MQFISSMRRVALITSAAMALPLAAQAAIDDEGVYIPAPGQEQYLGTVNQTYTESTTTTASPRAIPVEPAGTTTVIERSTSYYPPNTAAPLAAVPSSYDAMEPATSGEPRPARTPVNDELLSEQQVGNITFITGGVGEAERQAMERLRPKYNLRVTNAEKSGAFVSDAQVSIVNAKGEELLSTVTDPIFLANLPAGRYTIKSERGGQVKSQTITVGKGKPTQIQFGWM